MARDGNGISGGGRRLTRLLKRSFSLAGHRTSVALEPEFWSALSRIAARRGHTLSSLVSDADAKREPMQPLASSLRVFALRAFDPDTGAPVDAPHQTAETMGGED